VNGKVFRRHELVGIRALALLNARLGARYFVNSQFLGTVVRSHGTQLPVDVMPVYGVDTRLFSPTNEPKASLKAKRGLPTTGALLFFSSRTAPEKDSKTLLLAFAKLRAARRDLWLLHRSGAYSEFLGEAQQAGVLSRVIATDAVDPRYGLLEDYQASDLCLQASRAEGLGFSPLEAMACGTPVIATAVGGLKETVIEGQTGWTYPVGDAAALARCVEAALDAPAEAQRRAQAGRKMVVEMYDKQIVFDHLQDVVLQCTRQSSEPNSRIIGEGNLVS